MHEQQEKEFELSLPDRIEREGSSSNDGGDKTPEMDGQIKTMSLVMLAKSPQHSAGENSPVKSQSKDVPNTMTFVENFNAQKTPTQNYEMIDVDQEAGLHNR